jgi:hypothetical protein
MIISEGFNIYPRDLEEIMAWTCLAAQWLLSPPFDILYDVLYSTTA